jgi:hypothetical protein
MKFSAPPLIIKYLNEKVVDKRINNEIDRTLNFCKATDNQKFLNTLSNSEELASVFSPLSSTTGFSEVNYLSKPSSQSSPSTFGLNGGFI